MKPRKTNSFFGRRNAANLAEGGPLLKDAEQARLVAQAKGDNKRTSTSSVPRSASVGNDPRDRLVALSSDAEALADAASRADYADAALNLDLRDVFDAMPQRRSGIAGATEDGIVRQRRAVSVDGLQDGTSDTFVGQSMVVAPSVAVQQAESYATLGDEALDAAVEEAKLRMAHVPLLNIVAAVRVAASSADDGERSGFPSPPSDTPPDTRHSSSEDLNSQLAALADQKARVASWSRLDADQRRRLRNSVLLSQLSIAPSVLLGATQDVVDSALGDLEAFDVGSGANGDAMAMTEAESALDELVALDLSGGNGWKG